MSRLAGVRQWLHRKQLQFEATFAVYMYTQWEKFTFYSILFLLCGLSFIAAILYLPQHVFTLAGRAWYYIQGEDVGAAVRDVTAGVLGEALPTAVRASDALGRVDREL